MRFADLFGYKLKIVWIKETIFPCLFGDLFENANSFDVTDDFSLVYDVEHRNRHDIRYFRSQMEIPGFFAGFDDSDEDCVIATYKFLITKSEMDRFAPTMYCDLPHGATSSFRRHHDKLIPRREIQTRIDETLALFTENVIGIHLRKPEITRQPGEVPPFRWMPDKFVRERMYDALRKNANQRFFLSSDCKPTENRFVKEFGNRIIVSDKTCRVFEWDYSDEYKRDHFIKTTPQAIKEAFVDLTCLTKTSYIIRNLQSTFSSYAGVIGNVPTNIY